MLSLDNTCGFDSAVLDQSAHVRAWGSPTERNQVRVHMIFPNGLHAQPPIESLPCTISTHRYISPSTDVVRQLKCDALHISEQEIKGT